MEGHVLIVESDEYTAQKISEYTRSLGLTASYAKNGQLALVALRGNQPDLILLSDNLQDTDPSAFMTRMKKILGDAAVPVIALTSRAGGEKIKELLKTGVKSVILKPVQLDRYGKQLVDVLGMSVPASQNLNHEVFIRDDIIMIEVGGHLVAHDLVALKYRILDTARTHRSVRKRFFIIIYSLEKEELNQTSFDALFDFLAHFPKTPRDNIRILTSDRDVRAILQASDAARGIEVVDNYVQGLKKLKSRFLHESAETIKVRFLQPDTALFQDVYDDAGRLVKKKGHSFSQEEIDGLLKRGVHTLSYQRTVQIDEDQQIVAEEDVDIVMDTIQLTGVVVPQELGEQRSRRDAGKGPNRTVLIANSDEKELARMSDFFTSRNMSVRGARSADDSRAILEETAFDYCVVALELDDDSGLDLIRFIKKAGASRNFIVTATNVKEDAVREAMALGVRGFLKSPVDYDRLSSLFSQT
jgi:DNA-binding response OmpR family regulator